MTNTDAPAPACRALAGQLTDKPIVRDAAVLAGPEPDGLTVLVVRQGYRPGPVFRELVLRLAGRPWDEVLVAIVPQIPRTADGTVDEPAARQLLRERALILRYEPPVTEVEQQLAGLVGQVLPQTSVSMTDDLVSLGGDSLVAVELVGLIAELFRIEVSASDLFAAQSIREMAAVLARPAGSLA